MGLFDFITKTQEKLQKQSEELAQKLGTVQNQIETEQLDTLLKVVNDNRKRQQKVAVPKQSKVATQIIDRFYADYPEKPFISNDREAGWIGMAESMPQQCIIPKTMMQRFSDSLLPGHIYMLYWLGKYTNKRVPVYFEYKYGIDFAKEKLYLFGNGFLDDMDKPTEKGKKAIERHIEVVKNHAVPKPDQSIEGISKQILASRDNMKRNGFTHYVYIANRDACDCCRQLHEKVFPISQLKIGVNAPPMHDECKCSIAAYEDRAEYEKWLNSK